MDEYPYGVAEERAGRNRVAAERSLAEKARRLLDLEARDTSPYGRRFTRDKLASFAKQIGFTDLEISAAVDEALSKAGTTP